jgi:hypothetical protein
MFDEFGVVLGCFLGPFVTESVLCWCPCCILFLMDTNGSQVDFLGGTRHCWYVVVSKTPRRLVLDYSMGELVIDLPIALRLHCIPS